MNRKQKIRFIESNHPELYKILKDKVQNILKDDWVYRQTDVDTFNKIVIEYCQDQYPNLIRQLIFI